MTLLTADDVLKKTFQTTKFREGYDQDEVDDFLDEIVNTLRVLQTENAELKSKVAELEQAGPGEQDATAVVAVVADEAPAQPEAAPEPEPEPEPAPEPEAPAAPAPTPAKGVSEPESATGMLQLAQRLHDEYVRNGQVEGDRLVNEARAEADRLVGEAEGKRDRTLDQLKTEQATLEQKINQLRDFERDYRLRLKGYLGSLVEQLDAQAGTVGLSGNTPQL